jgi:peptide-methionine (S)-S-oxide reductase
MNSRVSSLLGGSLRGSLWAIGLATAGAFALPALGGPGQPRPTTSDGLALTKDTRLPLPPAERAAFAGGCFWGIEDAFRHQPGVLATAVGFMGGHTQHPTYDEVCTHDTGHAETVVLEFDPQVVSYEQLVGLFFDLHDPTTPNRQGPDVGDQYRSAIFTFNEAQQKTASAVRARLDASHELPAPIVTEIVKASTFTLAEPYHQQYVEHGGIAFCHVRRHHPAPNSVP